MKIFIKTNTSNELSHIVARAKATGLAIQSNANEICHLYLKQSQTTQTMNLKHIMTRAKATGLAIQSKANEISHLYLKQSQITQLGANLGEIYAIIQLQLMKIFKNIIMMYINNKKYTFKQV